MVSINQPDVFVRIYDQPWLHETVWANMLGSHVDMGLHWNLTALINSILVYIYISICIYSNFMIETGSVY